MFLPTKNIWNHLLSPLWTPTNGAATGPQALGNTMSPWSSEAIEIMTWIISPT